MVWVQDCHQATKFILTVMVSPQTNVKRYGNVLNCRNRAKARGRGLNVSKLYAKGKKDDFYTTMTFLTKETVLITETLEYTLPS